MISPFFSFSAKCLLSTQTTSVLGYIAYPTFRIHPISSQEAMKFDHGTCTRGMNLVEIDWCMCNSDLPKAKNTRTMIISQDAICLLLLLKNPFISVNFKLSIVG